MRQDASAIKVSQELENIEAAIKIAAVKKSSIIYRRPAGLTPEERNSIFSALKHHGYHVLTSHKGNFVIGWGRNHDQSS